MPIVPLYSYLFNESECNFQMLLVTVSLYVAFTITVSVQGQQQNGNRPTERPGRFLSLPVPEKCSRREYKNCIYNFFLNFIRFEDPHLTYPYIRTVRNNSAKVVGYVFLSRYIYPVPTSRRNFSSPFEVLSIN